MLKALLGLLSLAGAAAMVVACNGTSTPDLTSTTYQGTASPGDLWIVTFSPGTFSAQNTVTGDTFSGATTVLSSGFTQMRVTSPSTTRVATNAVGYTVTLPNSAVMMIPPLQRTTGVDPNAKAVFLVAQGPNASYSNGQTIIWTNLPSTNWSYSGSDAFGIFQVSSITGSTVTGNQYEYTLGQSPNLVSDIPTPYSFNFLGNGTGSGYYPMSPQNTCPLSSGTLVFNTFQLASSGAFIGDVAPQCSQTISVAGFVGMQAPTTSILPSFTSQSRNLRAVIFYSNSQSGQPNSVLGWTAYNSDCQYPFCLNPFVGGSWGDPTQATPTATSGGTPGSGEGVCIDLGTESTAVRGLFPNAFIYDSGCTSGSVLSNFTTSNHRQPAVFVINRLGGKYFVYGLAVNPTTPTKPFNFMLMEQ